MHMKTEESLARELAKDALRVGKKIARSHYGRTREVFSDDLAGDIARFAAFRVLRRRHQEARREQIEFAIEEVLTP